MALELLQRLGACRLDAHAAGDAGRRALDMMELERPALDWVGLARSMGVEARRAKTLEELERHFAAGVRSEGPYLIDLVL